MSALLAVALGLVIGLVIGGLGGGGGVLTVPALVHLLGEGAAQAVTGSLVIVGVSSVAGLVSHARAGAVRWRTGLVLGAVGIGSAYLGTSVGVRASDRVILVCTAGFMALAGLAMLMRGGDRDTGTDGPGGGGTAVAVRVPRRVVVALRTVAVGVVAGFLTGFLGVGGGFVLVPAMVIALGLPVPAAIGTSLLVIVLNSATALVSRAGRVDVDWSVVGPFTAAALVATLVGARVSRRLPSTTLSRAFGALLLAVAVLVAVLNLTGLAD
ncbi:MAG TPA: sulfite exporter TauE/SafE family protein [Pseudonocardia sp.]|nr:sulfite exporter TauE/SafE family protein [Pseudonocardia sp.]